MKLAVFQGIILVAMAASAADDLSLPDPLTTLQGKQISSPKQWKETRRPEILELFRANVYGRAPVGRPDKLRFEIKETTKTALSGRATRKLVDIHFSGPGGKGTIQLAVFIPNEVPKPVPLCGRLANAVHDSQIVLRPEC